MPDYRVHMHAELLNAATQGWYPKQKGATAFCLHLEHKEVTSSFLPKWCPHQLKKLSAESKISPTYIVKNLKANLYFALQLHAPLIHYFAQYYEGALAINLEAFSIFNTSFPISDPSRSSCVLAGHALTRRLFKRELFWYIPILSCLPVTHWKEKENQRLVLRHSKDCCSVVSYCICCSTVLFYSLLFSSSIPRRQHYFEDHVWTGIPWTLPNYYNPSQAAEAF